MHTATKQPVGRKAWLFGGAAAVLGVAVAATLLLKEGGSQAQFTPPPATVLRLTADQYRNIIADVFGPAIDLGGRIEPDLRLDGLLAVGASSVSVTAAGMEQYDAMADAIAQQVLMDPTNRAAVLGCEPAQPNAPDPACAEQFISRVGELLHRRPLERDDLQAYVQAANESAIALEDFHAGLAMSLSAMLSSPQFLFRVPHYTPARNDAKTAELDAYSKASQLSFFLWNSAPDRQLLDAAANGELDTRRGLRKQVERMMASPRLTQGVRAFFSDMLQFEKFDAVMKDGTLFPKFSRREIDDAREQTLATLVDQLVTREGDYRDVFTSKATFMSPSLAAIYRVPVAHEGPNGGPESMVPFEFPADDPRAGILTHVSFTALHSPAGRSSPTDRGKALREIIMCQSVPPPPPDVAFTFVQETDNPEFKTVRERLLAHATAPSCSGCHKIMDPIGLALENFDGSGEYRTLENSVPIDTSGELDGRSFDDPLGLGEAVRNNPAVPRCLVQRLTSYAFGQVPGGAQKALLQSFEQRFQRAEYRLPALMQEIALSEAFYTVTVSSQTPEGLTAAAH